MRFNPAIWRPLAIGAAVLNLAAAVWVAGRGGGFAHAAVHAVLALGFGLWAQRLAGARSQAPADPAQQLDNVEGELYDLRREVAELEERLDFAERLLARKAEEEARPKPEGR